MTTSLPSRIASCQNEKNISMIVLLLLLLFFFFVLFILVLQVLLY
jgi:hypothetical protein